MTCVKVRRRAEEALRRELAFCSHLGLSAVIVRLRRGESANLARAIYSYLVKNPGPQVWVRVPMEEEQSLAAQAEKEQQKEDQKREAGDSTSPAPSSAAVNDEVESHSTWSWWDDFRSAANYEKKMGLALEVGKEPPSEDTIKRWLGEPVRALVLNTR